MYPSINRRLRQALGWAEVGDAHTEEDWPYVICPDPIPGTVSDQAGFFTALTDVAALAESGDSAASIQTQQPILASDRAGVCQRERDAQAVTGASMTRQAGETWLMVGLYRFWCVPGEPDGGSDLTRVSPLLYPPTPIILRIGHGTEGGCPENPLGASCAYTVNAKYAPAKGADQSATAGTVTVTTWTAELVELIYDLTFKAGRVTGRMVAPACVIC